MAFLKENLNAFLDQPIERKRSDHRLKKADSVVDTRAWVLNEDLKRQQFLNVVNQAGDVGAERREDLSEPRSWHLTPQHSDLKVGEKLKELNEEKDFLRNVIADKENEIERLLLRIQTMAEDGDGGVSPTEASGLEKKLDDMMKQLNAKEGELKRTKDLLNNTEKMLKDLQNLIESTGEDPEKQKKQLDNIMKGLQIGMQDDIEQLQNTVRELEEKLENANSENSQMRSELAALASGDENELSRTIMKLRNELDRVKMAKDAENQALKDAVSKKDDELKALQNMLNQQNPDKMSLPESFQDYSRFDIDRLKEMLDNKDKSIKLLKDELENEKQQNDALKKDLDLLVNSNDNELQNKVLALSSELENLRSKPPTDSDQPEDKRKADTIKGSLVDKINDLENLLYLEKELSENLKKDLANQKEKFDRLALADDDELKRMLADAERQIEELNKDKETHKLLIKSLESDDKMPDDYKQLKRENIELKDEINKLKNGIKELQEGKVPVNTNDLMKENEILKRENQALKNDNDMLMGADKERIKTAMISKFPDKSADVEKDELQKANDKLKNELEVLKRSLPLSSQKDQLLSPKHETVDGEEMKIRLDQLENENEKLKSILKEENDKYNKTIAEKDQHINTLQHKLNKMSKENEPLVQKSENQSDKNQLGSNSPEIEELKTQIDTLESQNTALKSEKDYCNENVKSLNNKMEKLKEENENLRKTISSFEDSSSKIPSTPLHTKEFSSDQDVQKCIQDKQKLEAELDKLKQTLAHSQKEKEQSKEPSTRKPEEKDDELKVIGDISLLKDENEQLKAANERLKQDIDKLKGELEKLKKEDMKPVQESVLKKESKSPEINTKELQDENLKLKSKVKDLEDKIMKIQSSYPEVKSKIPNEKDDTHTPDSGQQQLIKEKNENLKLAKENEDLRNEISDLKKQLNESQRKNFELDKEKRPLLPSNAEEAGRVNGDSMLDICKNNLEKLKKENSNLKERINALEKELKQTKVIDSTSDKKGLLVPEGSTKSQTDKNDKANSDESKLKDHKYESPPVKPQISESHNKNQRELEPESLKSPSQTKPGKSPPKDIDGREKPAMSQVETPEEQQLSVQKDVDKSDKKLPLMKETKGKPFSNKEETDSNINKSKKEKLGVQPSPLKKTAENADKPSTSKSDIPTKDFDNTIKDDGEAKPVKNAKETSKVQFTSKSDIDKSGKPLTSKSETSKEEFTKKSDVDKKDTTLTSKKGTPMDQAASKKEDVSTKPSSAKVTLQDQPAKAKDVFDKKEEKGTPLKQATSKKEDLSVKPSAKVTLQDQLVKPKDEFEKKDEKESPLEQSASKKEDVGVKPTVKDTPKDHLGKAKDGLDKKEGKGTPTKQVTSKKEEASVKPSAKVTLQDQPAAKDNFDKKENKETPSKQSASKKEDASVEPSVKVIPKDHLAKTKDGFEKKEEKIAPIEKAVSKKEDVSVKPSAKVTSEDPLAKAKDVIGKREDGELSSSAKTFTQSPRSQPTTKESIQSKIEPKEGIDKSTPIVNTKPKEKGLFTDKEDGNKITPEKITTKDGKTLPGKETFEPKENVPIKKEKPAEEIKVDQTDGEHVIYDDKKKHLPEYSDLKNEGIDNRRFPMKDTSRKQKKTTPDSGTEKTIPEAISKPVKIGKETDFDNLQKGLSKSVDRQMLSASKTVDKLKDKGKTKFKPSLSVEEASDLASGKEKAKKRKVDVFKRKKEPDYDTNLGDQQKYELATIKDTKAEKTGEQPKVRGMSKIEDSRTMYDPDVSEAQKRFETLSQGYGDKELDNELNELKKKLSEAEKQIKHLKNENLILKTKIEELKQVQTPREKMDRFEEENKFLDEDKKKLNRILRKAINQGLKTLYLEELEYLHDSMNDTMADRLKLPRTPGTKSPEELERLINNMEQKMASLMNSLNVYKQLSTEQSNKNSQYSQKVQQLNIELGLQKMEFDSLLKQNGYLRDLLNNEKIRVKNLQDMLREVLDNCKCVRKGVFNQYYPGLVRT